MFINKIISIIISITSIIVIPAQAITTLILGLVANLTFGLLLIPLSFLWAVLFYYPLIGLSYLYEKNIVFRPVIVLIGIPLAILGNTYVALIPSMGEKESRYIKLIYCQSFPYSYRFHLFYLKKTKLKEGDVLIKVLKEISRAEPLKNVLGKIIAKNII